MKKIISILVIVCMLATMALSLVSCGGTVGSRKGIRGTEAAKLLLADERLDTQLLASSIDVGLSGSPKSSVSAGSFPGFAMLSSSESPYVLPLSQTGDSYAWSDFSAYSPSLYEFNVFMEMVEQQVAQAANNIEYMKDTIGVTDKWVDYGEGHMQMLRVFENYDCLLIKDRLGSTFVYNRYTDENARNYYELYAHYLHENGRISDVRILYIPGERYEYMIEDTEGARFFIAENSRGYWVNTDFFVNTVDFSGVGLKARFTTNIVKDGLGYGYTTEYIVGPEGDEQHHITDYTAFDPNTGRELIRVPDVSGNEDQYKFELYYSAIKNGLVSVSAKEFYTPFDNDVHASYSVDTLTTVKGTYTASRDMVSWDEWLARPENEFSLESAFVDYAYYEECYYGALAFVTKSSLSLDDACVAFGNHLSSIGLALYCDMQTVALSLEHARLMAESFEESFEWNGYILSDIDKVDDALEVTRGHFAGAKATLESVKDFEVVAFKEKKLASDAKFAPITMSAVGENRAEGATVTISGIAVQVSDLVLFEEGKQYVLKVGLSLVDENGNPISVNTIALAGGNSTPATINGNSITLSASGEYAIPVNLHSGRYAAVVYVATADEGIRVSEIHKIAFVDIKEGEIESAAMLMEAFNVDASLVIRYDIKNSRHLVVSATKEAYTYAEIEQMLLLEILTQGAPFHGATLETQDGEKIALDATLGKGVYRMMCYLNTADGLSQAYAYLTLE